MKKILILFVLLLGQKFIAQNEQIPEYPDTRTFTLPTGPTKDIPRQQGDLFTPEPTLRTVDMTPVKEMQETVDNIIYDTEINTLNIQQENTDWRSEIDPHAGKIDATTTVPLTETHVLSDDGETWIPKGEKARLGSDGKVEIINPKEGYTGTTESEQENMPTTSSSSEMFPTAIMMLVFMFLAIFFIIKMGKKKKVLFQITQKNPKDYLAQKVYDEAKNMMKWSLKIARQSSEGNLQLESLAVSMAESKVNDSFRKNRQELDFNNLLSDAEYYELVNIAINDAFIKSGYDKSNYMAENSQNLFVNDGESIQNDKQKNVNKKIL